MKSSSFTAKLSEKSPLSTVIDDGSSYSLHLLGQHNLHILDIVHNDVFDDEIDLDLLSQFIRQTGNFLFVAQDGCVAIAYLSAYIQYFPDKPSRLVIAEIAVAPPYQCRGLGKALMKQALRTAKQQNCHSVCVMTEEDNQTAQSLYSSLGFSCEEVRLYSRRTN